MLEIYFYGNKLQEVEIEGLDFLDKIENKTKIAYEDSMEYYLVNNFLYIIENRDNGYVVYVYELLEKVKYGDVEDVLIIDESINRIYSGNSLIGYTYIKYSI